MRDLAKLFSEMSIECRHGIYVWWLTFACLTGIMLITLTRTGPIAEHAVDAFASIMTILVGSYLGIEAVSRSQILNKLAERMGTNPPAPESEAKKEPTL